MKENSTSNTETETNSEYEALLDDLKANLAIEKEEKPKVEYYNPTDTIEYVNYRDETQMNDIMKLIQKDLSEPYSIYTYRYFIHNWPQLCFLVK